MWQSLSGSFGERKPARAIIKHAPLREQLTATDRSAAQTAPEGRQPAPKRWLLPHKTAQKVSLFCVTLRAPFAQNRTKKGFCVTLGGLTAARLSAHLRGSAT